MDKQTYLIGTVFTCIVNRAFPRFFPFISWGVLTTQGQKIYQQKKEDGRKSWDARLKTKATLLMQSCFHLPLAHSHLHPRVLRRLCIMVFDVGHRDFVPKLYWHFFLAKIDDLFIASEKENVKLQLSFVSSWNLTLYKCVHCATKCSIVLQSLFFVRRGSKITGY